MLIAKVGPKGVGGGVFEYHGSWNTDVAWLNRELTDIMCNLYSKIYV